MERGSQLGATGTQHSHSYKESWHVGTQVAGMRNCLTSHLLLPLGLLAGSPLGQTQQEVRRCGESVFKGTVQSRKGQRMDESVQTALAVHLGKGLNTQRE